MGRDTGSKLNALIRRFCKYVACRELDNSRKSVPGSLGNGRRIDLGSGVSMLCCGSISSVEELNRTAGEPPAAF